MSGRERRIEHYGLIGDGETAALVGRDGSIDWLCMPRFDSAACFAALLGDDQSGCWKMAPAEAVTRSSRRYLGETLILETEFETESGRAAVIDFMPIRGRAPDIVRIVEGRQGTVRMVSQLMPRFDYGQVHPLVQTLSDVRAVAIAGPDAVALDFDTPIDFDDRRFTSRFSVSPGENVTFVMTWFPSYEEVPDRVNPAEALADTHRYWQRWIGGVDYRSDYRAEVVRSLITLKALSHGPTGSIIAAPTSSLPEQPGGSRNWDYRFCWLRDATFTLLAFLQAGLDNEARAWIEWLRRAVGGEPIDLQPFYSVGGDRRAIEWTADWLDGFNGAQPVRFGNGAAAQCQLDIYGETIDALFRAAEHGMADNEDTKVLMRLLADRLAEIWRQADAGIWESRGEPRQHVYSKVMCWVAFDRAARRFEGDDRATAGRYRALADEAHALVCDRGFHKTKNSFTQTLDGETLDASALRIPLVGFLPADDPRIKGTVAAIERELMPDGLVLRYSTDTTDDGVGGGEGAFLAASYWLADVYAMQNRREDARALFERVTRVANDLGLLAEEYSCRERRLLGNFPQALSHLSLVNTAMNLSAGGGPAQKRADEKAADEAAGDGRAPAA